MAGGSNLTNQDLDAPVPDFRTWESTNFKPKSLSRQATIYTGRIAKNEEAGDFRPRPLNHGDPAAS